MESLNTAYHFLYLIALMVVGLGLVFSLIRAIRGPRTADRILGVNMAGTMTSIALALLAWLLDMDALLDVCLVYCLASFLSVVVLSKVYVTAHQEKSEAHSELPYSETMRPLLRKERDKDA